MPKTPLVAPLAVLAALACGDSDIEVTGVRPARRDIESALITNGRIEAASGAAIHAAVSGRVRRVTVQRGDEVREKQSLAWLADTGQLAAQAAATAQLEAAKARLSLLEGGLDPARTAVLQGERSELAAARAAAKQDAERLRRLVEREAAPRSDAERAERALAEIDAAIATVEAQLEAPGKTLRRDELEAAVAEAEAAVAEAGRALAALAVRAPMAGTVYSLAVRAGDFLEAGSLVARIAGPGGMRARVFVDEPDLARIRQGEIALLSADAYPGRVWNCSIGRLPTEIVEMEARRVGVALCSAEDPDGVLIPNLAVGVRIVTDRAANALSVPRSAVRSGNGSAFVWVAPDGRAERREVDLGTSGPVHVEIRRGLGETDAVLLPGGDNLQAGQSVRVRLEAGREGD